MLGCILVYNPIYTIILSLYLCMDHIYLLSHMRANTSLIGHLLGSHPQISGYYEMHQSYSTTNDLLQQQKNYLINDPIKKNSHYLFDKILHNQYLLDLNQIKPKSVKVLVSIRNPEQSIKSMINLFKQKKQYHKLCEPKAAIEYYNQRINYLASFCLNHPNTYYYFDANLIRDNPENLLAQIQKWLSLSLPFNTTYQTYSQTGVAKAGDSSALIKKGAIVAKQTDYTNIKIPQQLLQYSIDNTHLQRALIIKNSHDYLSEATKA